MINQKEDMSFPVAVDERDNTLFDYCKELCRRNKWLHK